MRALMVAALMVAFAAAAPATPAAAQTVERLYVMDCGHNAATDQARWSPGVNVGKPIELSDNCYLIKHGGAVAAVGHRLSRFAGRQAGHQPRSARRRRAKKLAPSSPRSTSSPTTSPCRRLAHPSATMSATSTCSRPSTLLIQKAEVDWAFADGKQAPFKKDRPMQQLERRPRRVRRRLRRRSCRRPATRRGTSRCWCTCRKTG